MMKRTIAFLLTMLMVSALFAGCGTGSSPNTAAPANPANPAAPAAESGETITLKYLTHQEIPWNKNDDKMIAAFEAENPGIKIERESFPYDEFESKAQTSMMSKSGGADIYKLWGGWAVDYASTGAFAPVPDAMRDDLIEDCYEPVLGAFLHEGNLYGVPLEFNAEYGGMLANKPYFDEHGIAYPTTWDDMIKIATDNSESEGDVFNMRGFDFISWDSMPYTWLSMILSSGGQYVTDGNKFDFNTPVAIESLQKLADYITVNKVTSISGLSGGGDLENFNWLFLGEALMAPRGIWTIPTGIDDYEVVYGEDFDYIPMPFYGSEKAWAAETGWGLAVNAGSQNSDAAWKYVEFIMAPENLLQVNVECAMIPPRKSVAHNPEFIEAMPYAKPIVDVLDGAKYVGYVNTDILKEAITEAFVDMVLNGTPASEAVLSINAAMAG